MLITDCGWQTTTTKSRLNVLIREFARFGGGITQRKFEWFLDRGVNVCEMNSGEVYSLACC